MPFETVSTSGTFEQRELQTERAQIVNRCNLPVTRQVRETECFTNETATEQMFQPLNTFGTHIALYSFASHAGGAKVRICLQQEFTK